MCTPQEALFINEERIKWMAAKNLIKIQGRLYVFIDIYFVISWKHQNKLFWTWISIIICDG